MPFSYLDKDSQVAAAVSAELSRQRDSIELIRVRELHESGSYGGHGQRPYQ